MDTENRDHSMCDLLAWDDRFPDGLCPFIENFENDDKLNKPRYNLIISPPKQLPDVSQFLCLYREKYKPITEPSDVNYTILELNLPSNPNITLTKKPANAKANLSSMSIFGAPDINDYIMEVTKTTHILKIDWNCLRNQQ